MTKIIKDTENVVSESFEKIGEIVNNIIDEKVINNVEETIPVVDNVEAAEKLKLETEAAEKSKTLEETDIINKIVSLLKQENHYSHLRCGRFLKENITIEKLELFYNEFVSYGITSNIDSEVIKNIEILLKK